MIKKLATGILLVPILACAILVIKLKHCDKGVVAEPLIGYKCGHVVIHPDSEFTFVVFLQKHLTEFVLFKTLKRKATDIAGEQLDWYSTKCILHTLSILQHISAPHTFHH